MCQSPIVMHLYIIQNTRYLSNTSIFLYLDIVNVRSYSVYILTIVYLSSIHIPPKPCPRPLLILGIYCYIILDRNQSIEMLHHHMYIQCTKTNDSTFAWRRPYSGLHKNHNCSLSLLSTTRISFFD